MHFHHAPEIWAAYPQLVPTAMVVRGITASADASAVVQEFSQRAAARLADKTESELAEIQAWRRAFSQMGLKPTQYRCASEALLRRFRKEGRLPPVHPLVDLCNAVSMAYAVPIAALDLDHIDASIEVRPATGEESYLTFGGEIERPEPGEIIFGDAAGRAHCRRWTNRQSGLSAVNATTSSVLIISEALHESAGHDQPRLLDDLAAALAQTFQPSDVAAVLTADAPGLNW